MPEMISPSHPLLCAALLVGMLLASAPAVCAQGTSLTRQPNSLTERARVDPFDLETLEAKIERLRRELKEAEALLEESKAVVPEPDPSIRPVGEIPPGALVVVTGDQSSGSGFIGKLRERTFFITNIHVLGLARGASFKTMDGQAVPLGPTAYLSKQRDIAIVPLEWGGPVLEISPSLSFDEVAIGQGVTVMGNSDGASVVTRMEGEIRGIGPDELEVSAKFVPGNSGSPIVHDELGTVVAIASHLRDYTGRDNRSKDSDLGDVRRFGFRLDGEIDWEQASLNELFEQAELYHRFEDRTQVMWKISYQLGYKSKLVTSFRSHESLGYLYDAINDSFEWERGVGSSHNQQLLRRFVSGIMTEAQKDVQSTEDDLWVGFYLSRYEDIKAARDDVKANIKQFADTRL